MVRIVALIAVVFGAGGCHRPEPAKADAVVIPRGEAWLTAAQVTDLKIAVAKVDEQVIEDTLVTAGEITFDDQKVSHVFSPVTGRVTTVLAQLGQHVKKGDPLAEILSPDVGLASADLARANAEYIAAAHAYEREKVLFDQHATSERDLEKSEDEWRKARAELWRAQQKARLLQAGGGAVTQLYTLRAALEGTVLARNVTPGVEVQGQYANGAAIEVFTVGELDPVWVLADIFEIDLARVRVGERATIKVVTYPGRTFDGTIDYVGGMLDAATRTARVRCVLANTEGLLKAHMYATLQLSIDARRALAIPRSALVHLGDSTLVFVALGAGSDGRARYERRPVIVDEVEAAPFLRVSHGVEAGEEVVVAGASTLSGLM